MPSLTDVVHENNLKHIQTALRLVKSSRTPDANSLCQGKRVSKWQPSLVCLFLNRDQVCASVGRGWVSLRHNAAAKRRKSTDVGRLTVNALLSCDLPETWRAESHHVRKPNSGCQASAMPCGTQKGIRVIGASIRQATQREKPQQFPTWRLTWLFQLSTGSADSLSGSATPQRRETETTRKGLDNSVMNEASAPLGSHRVPCIRRLRHDDDA